MRTKILILIIGIIFSSYWIKTTKSDVNDIPIPNSNKQLIKHEENHTAKVLPAKAPKKKIKELQISEEITLELSQQNYSSEPLLEAVSVSMQMYSCNRRYGNYSSSQHSERYEALYLKNQETCAEIKSNYPVISNLKESKNVEAIFIKIAMQSKYVNFIQKAMTIKYMSAEEQQLFLSDSIQTIIKSKNAPLLSLLGEIPPAKESQLFYNQLFAMLGTVNTSYTKIILVQASTLFSCRYNQGLTCSPTSTFMLKTCADNENACGLDVPTWFQTNNTPAHNRDIAKLVEYFESLID